MRQVTWTVGIAAALAACQTFDPEDRDTIDSRAPAEAGRGREALSIDSSEAPAEDACYGVANFCGATLPPITHFTTKLPPEITPSTVIVLVPGEGGLMAYGADPAEAKVHWALAVADSKIGLFMRLVLNGFSNPVGVRPPSGTCPPLCGDGALVLEVALRARSIQADATEARNACYPKIP
jgi:hypothetical protein